jgi:hypothetical protein
MLTSNNLRRSLALTLILLISFSSSTVVAQDKKKKKDVPQGTPVLWKNPADIRTRDLFLGPGGEAMKPDTSNLTFIKEEKGGYSPKFRVRDRSGREWVAKLGKEAQSETVAVRLLWAVGYPTEINYLVPCVQIKGAPKKTKKKVERCAGQGFANVRFEARPDNVKRAGEWKWKRNPFVGTRELQGLIVMMALFNNWDTKDSNNVIFYVKDGSSERGESRYVISDLGATFGKTGNFPLLWRLTRSRNNPKDYARAKFIDKVKGERVAFRYGGKNRGLFKNITVEQAKWIGGLLSRLSDQQLGDAFRAANYSPAEIRMLTQAVRRRINELVRLPEPGLASLTGRDEDGEHE